MQVKEIFDIKYGKRGFYFKNQPIGPVPYISSTSKNRGVMGFVETSECFEDVITVPRNGSVCHSFYQKNKCVINDDCLILTAKIPLSEREKIFYSLVFRNFKNLFAYGRKVTPERLGVLSIPSKDEVPCWVNSIKINDYSDIAEPKSKEVINLPPVEEWRIFRYQDIFNMTRGIGPSATEAKKNFGETPYLGASAEKNGVTHTSNHKASHKGNVITISSDGSVGEAFYQPKDFNATTNITVISFKDSKIEMNSQIGLFLCTLIRKEKYKFNYGRKWGLQRMKDSIIKLPVDKEGNIDTELITKYINSLAYSKYL